MEPEIIAVMGTVIVGLAAALGKMALDNHNNKPKNTDGHNPVVDLHTTKLGDMSAAWYEEKHEELLGAIEELTNAVKGKPA